jgi:hypothetical protein
MSFMSRTPIVGLLLLAGCATIPSGPSVMVLPGTGKSFDAFRADDLDCRQFAQQQIGGADPNQAAIDSGVASAAVGTVIGAAAGAAIGGRGGAATGAGTGLAIGALAGTGAGQASGYSLQRRYDFGYQQCMYAKGNRVPVAGRFADPHASPYGAPPPSYIAPPPPPPPGTPPPPPPR